MMFRLTGQRRLSLPAVLIPRRVVTALRLVWVVAIVWYELGTFFWSVSDCRWPDTPLKKGGSPGMQPAHVLLIADPQVMDRHSYPGRSWWLSALSQFIVDFNLRKSWNAVRRFRPDVVVFLGDMMDNGRAAYDDQVYQEYYERFRSIFLADSSTAVYYIPGNHDVGLGSVRMFSPHSRKRYITHFGPLNHKVSIANHTLVMLDAPGLAEEDYRRAASGQSFENWPAPPGGAIDFVNKFASVGTEEPVVLFSHIPLFRPDTAPCGPLREKGTIRRGVGYGYQNTLGRFTSDYILKYVRPSVIFSGDDHDYCEYTHSIPLVSEGPEPKIEYVREVTVKSISMAAMGIRRPGFQLLSLVSPSDLTSNKQSFADRPCLLPDQLSIYVNRYLPLLVISLVMLSISSYRKIRSRKNIPRGLDLTPPLSSRSQPVYEHPEPGVWSATAPIAEAGESSPESSTLISTARTPRNPAANGALLVPTYRATNFASPSTPDFTTSTPQVSPGVFAAGPSMLNAPPAGLAALPTRLYVSGDDDDNDEDDDLMAPVHSAGRPNSSFNYFSLTSGRPARRRRLAWTWTFVFRGRRRRVTVGVPPLLEKVCCGPCGKTGRGERATRSDLVKTLVGDLLATAWPPAAVSALIMFVMFR